MNISTARIESEPVTGLNQVLGEVIDTLESGWLVQSEEGRLVVQRAASCLLKPQSGDVVLLLVGDHSCWILAVLERDGHGESLLEVPGDFVLRTRSGRVQLDGAKGIGLSSACQVEIDAPHFSLRTRLAELVTARLNWLGQVAEARFDGIRMVGRLFDSVVERFSRKAVRSYRTVEETDQVRSGQIDYRAEGNMTLRGRNVLTRAKELAKLDGDQIHLG